MAEAKEKRKVKMPGSLRQKLTAATAMLLISAILLVTATYAWFTLSTSPEVTGISTSVGANGNLEIALVDNTTYSSPGSISSAVGDSYDTTQNYTTTNLTWGNIVDLSDGSYGLDSITLLPSRLNLDETGALDSTSLLQYPVYGSDGRVASLSSSGMLTGIYDSDSSVFTADSGYGVRAVGTASGLSEEELALRSATSNITTYMNYARKAANSALSTYGSALASIAMDYALNSSDSYDQDDVDAISATITALQGAADYIGTAIKYAVVAYAASQGYIIEASSLTISVTNSSTATISGADSISIPSTISTILESYAALVYSLSEAASAVPTDASNSDGTYTWSDISSSLSAILDTDAIEINGSAVDDIDDYSSLISSVMSEGLTVTFGSGSGAFGDIADFAGDYSATVSGLDVTYEGLTVSGLTATVEAETDLDTTYLAALASYAADLEVTSSDDEDSDTTITDTYGYVIDLAFRTNASDSYLQLQTEAAQRVYDDSSNTATQGSGSYMEFEATTDEFTDAEVISLMAAIRVVFVDSTGEILAVAALDTENATTDSGTVQAYLYLYDYTIKDGVLTISDQSENTAITSLTQNTAEVISAIVYLDGDYVDNGDVANAATSMTGTMNLQFSSSTTLVPMTNTDLYDGASSSDSDEE